MSFRVHTTISYQKTHVSGAAQEGLDGAVTQPIYSIHCRAESDPDFKHTHTHTVFCTILSSCSLKHDANWLNCTSWRAASEEEMRNTHRSGSFPKINLQPSHGSYDCNDGLNGIAVDDNFILLTLVLGIAILMNDSSKRRKPQVNTMNEKWKLWIFMKRRKFSLRRPCVNLLHLFHNSTFTRFSSA